MVQIVGDSSLDSELQKPPCYTHVIQLLFDSIFDMYFIFYYNISFLYVLFFCMQVIYRIFFYHCYNGDLCLFILGLFLVIRIGIILSLTSLYVLSLGFCVCFLGSMIISGILFIYYFYDDFYLSLTYDNPFCLFICCFGLWVYNPCDMGIIELFISQNWDLFIRFLFCLCFLG